MNGGIVTTKSASRRIASGDVMVKSPDDRASLAKPPSWRNTSVRRFKVLLFGA